MTFMTFMTDKAGKKKRPAGWLIHALEFRFGAKPKLLLFSAAISDQCEALQAVRVKLDGLHVEGPYIIARLSKRALSGIKRGDVHADDRPRA